MLSHISMEVFNRSNNGREMSGRNSPHFWEGKATYLGGKKSGGCRARRLLHEVPPLWRRLKAAFSLKEGAAIGISIRPSWSSTLVLGPHRRNQSHFLPLTGENSMGKSILSALCMWAGGAGGREMASAQPAEGAGH